jgi:hypothetical protein
MAYEQVTGVAPEVCFEGGYAHRCARSVAVVRGRGGGRAVGAEW